MNRLPSICILDYGSGNVGSVHNICKTICRTVTVSNKPDDIASASHLILPGVGAFGPSMQKIESRIPTTLLERYVIDQKKPFLGICVGMQVLFTHGCEGGDSKGLNWIPGSVDRLSTNGQRLPHIGWNSVEFSDHSWFYDQFSSPEDFYFVHSYGVACSKNQSGVAYYGEPFVAAIEQENLFGVQFHPEKSQEAGQALLRRFLEYPSNA